MKEYIKIFWSHESTEDPIIILYEIDTDNERLVTRSIDVFLDRTTNNIEDFYAGVLEIVAIPKVEELNNGIWGTEIQACLIDKDEFEIDDTDLFTKFFIGGQMAVMNCNKKDIDEKIEFLRGILNKFKK